ncbi:hypothetical protein K353_05246 [Kitasatospora sp. SolWspMP-SS2h]|nr:hypothetical protein [Kitasatospora sp. SolWspMP-SS2h]RAJ34600.1 hypothetical protein K353_05246 [Kitasatospora sp. SolWspMP-SS2h]
MRPTRFPRRADAPATGAARARTTPYTPARLCGGGYLDTIWTSG